jgi:hypothetical protein
VEHIPSGRKVGMVARAARADRADMEALVRRREKADMALTALVLPATAALAERAGAAAKVETEGLAEPAATVAMEEASLSPNPLTLWERFLPTSPGAFRVSVATRAIMVCPEHQEAVGTAATPART